MKIIFSLVLFLTVQFSLFSQCPTAGITLSTQSAVDNFTVNYPGCSVMPAGSDLIITGTNITNLNGLSSLQIVNGAVEIRNNPALTSLDGFSPVYAGSDLIIRSNPLIQNLNSLSGLDTVAGEFVIRSNQNLNSITGLGLLKRVGLDFIVRDNAPLVSLTGLENLKAVHGLLEITDNASLNSLSALSNLDSIYGGGPEGAVFIDNNPLLATLAGLGNNNTFINGDVVLTNNGSLAYCSVPSICNFINNPPSGAIATISLNNPGCNSVPEVQSQCLVLTINEHVQESNFHVFPNPANNVIEVVNGFAQEQEFVITNLLGETVARQTLTQGRHFIDISHLNAGVYHVVFSDLSRSISRKLVVYK